MEAKGNLDKEEIDQIEQFMSSKDIRFCFYKDTHKILGQTFGMCVLQDFESLRIKNIYFLIKFANQREQEETMD